MVEWLFLAVPQGCLQFVIVVFPDHTHLLYLSSNDLYSEYFLTICLAIIWNNIFTRISEDVSDRLANFTRYTSAP